MELLDTAPTIENPKLSIDDLNTIEDKIKKNSAVTTDYEILDNYLSFIGVDNYILNKLREKRINNYNEFINLRKNKNSDGDINMLVGSVLGVISILKDFVAGKL